MFQRNNANAIVPSYPGRPWYEMNANDPPDNTCYFDPKTGQIICDATEEEPPPPEEPDDPGEDSPPELDPMPPTPEETIGKFIAGLIQVVATLFNSGPPLTLPPLEPVKLSERRSVRIPQDEPTPLRPLPQAGPPLGQTVQGSPYYQALSRIREIQRQQTERLIERSEPRDRGYLARGIAEAYGSNQLAALDPQWSNQSSSYNIDQPLVDPLTQAAYRNLLNPPSGADAPFLQEDPRWIEQNLAQASKPRSWQEQARLQQFRQQANTQQQMQQAQLDAARAQRELYEAQTQAIRWQHYRENERKAPSAFKATAYKSRPDVIRDKLFNEPNQAKSLLDQLENFEQMDESRFEQMELNLENMANRGEITAQEKTMLKAGIRSIMTRHWLTHEVAYTDQETAVYRDVEMPVDVAPYAVYADAKHYLDTYQHLSKQKLEQVSKDFANALANGTKRALQIAYDLWIGDDIKTLTDPKANLFWRAVAGASLLSNFVPAGLVGKVGGKILGKVTGKVSSKVLNRIGEMLEKKGVQHLGDIPQNTGDWVNDTKKLELVRERLKKELNLIDLPDDHQIMQEFKRTHGKQQAWSGRAASTEVFTTKDKQTVIFRTRVNKNKTIQEAEFDKEFSIWTSAIHTEGKGTVVLQGHENYRKIGNLPDGRIKSKFTGYEEYIPGPKAILGEKTRISRSSTREQVAIDMVEDGVPTEQIMEKLEKRWDTFVLNHGGQSL